MRRRMILAGAATCATLALALALLALRSRGPAPTSAAGRFEVRWMPLGVAPYSGPPHHLNDAGQVAVDVAAEDDLGLGSHAAVWSVDAAEPRVLGSRLWRLLGLEEEFSRAHAINEKGHVVGQLLEIREIPLVAGMRPTPALVPVGAFLWSPADGMRRLPHFTPGDINERDQVVGTGATPALRVLRALLWEPGAPPRDLGALTPEGESFAVAINERGWVAGFTIAEASPGHPPQRRGFVAIPAR